MLISLKQMLPSTHAALISLYIKQGQKIVPRQDEFAKILVRF